MQKPFLSTAPKRCPDCNEVIVKECQQCNGTGKMILFQNKCIFCGAKLEDGWACCPICKTDIIQLPCARCNGTGEIDTLLHFCPAKELKNKNRFGNEDEPETSRISKEQDALSRWLKKDVTTTKAFEAEKDKFLWRQDSDDKETSLKTEDSELNPNSLNSNRSKGMLGFLVVIIFVLFVLAVITGFIDVILRSFL